MLYGGEPLKPAPPAKICIPRNKSFNGPQPNTYSILAKQPGSDYKIRIRDMERVRKERFRMKQEDDFKSCIKHVVHKELIDVSDRKYFYNQVKRMVECGMKANEHLFLEKSTKPEPKEEEEKLEEPKIAIDDLIEKAEELKKKNNEKERKLVEEKRLQMFINNSEELRFAAMAKRKKDIDEFNYRTVQEKESLVKEQTIKRRELANAKNLEIIKMQTLEKEEEKRKCLERQQQFRNDLYEQVAENEEIRRQEKELKAVEYNELKILNEKLNEEIEFEKLQKKQKQIERKAEIKQFIEEREKLLSNMHNAADMLTETLAATTQHNLKDDAEDAKEAKTQLRRENEMFKKHHAMIKEERRRQAEEMSMTVMKQIDEIQKIKRSIELENFEARRKRAEDGNNALIEQIKAREKLLEQQKEAKRKLYEQTAMEYERYLEEERQLCEKKKQFKQQVRKDLKDQINFKQNIIEKQRQIDLENRRKSTEEFTEQEKLLEKLLNELGGDAPQRK